MAETSVISSKPNKGYLFKGHVARLMTISEPTAVTRNFTKAETPLNSRIHSLKQVPGLTSAAKIRVFLSRFHGADGGPAVGAWLPRLAMNT